MTLTEQSDNSFFQENGYLVKKNLINEGLIAEACNALELKGTGNFDMLSTIKTKALINLLFSPSIHNCLGGIFTNNNYSLHHITSALHTKQTPSLSWHHDKVPAYSRRKKSLMVHVLIYPSGMNYEIGKLLLIPGSHKWLVDRYQLSKVPLNAFKHEEIGYLPRGSAVFVNSALVHARESLPSQSDQSKRHFIDMSFCQNTINWEPYLESSTGWSKLFEHVQKMLPVESKKYDYILNTRPYKMSFPLNLLPNFIQNKLYLLKSFYHRRVSPTKDSKLEIN